MKILKTIVCILWCTLLLACQSKQQSRDPLADNNPIQEKLSAEALQELETAYFASGCFWCVEAIFESVIGVKEVVSGYAGGTEVDPTYEQVAYGKTSHAEAVKIYYDPDVVTFPELVRIFFGSHDPTTLNRQGPDRGAQYRSIAFYNSDREKKAIEDYKAKLENEGVYSQPIVTEVKRHTVFYEAEAYHQDFERNNPNNSYIRNVSIPRFNKFKKKFPEYVKKDH